MKSWPLELRVGLILALAIVFFLYLLFNTANWRWGAGNRTFYVTFHFVNDIQEGATVYLAGVPVGRVRHIGLTPDGVRVEIGIADDEQPLREGCRASISMLGIVGESVLFLENGPRENPVLPSGSVIEGRDPVNVMESVRELSEVVSLSVGTLRTVQEVLRRQDEQITMLATRLQQWMAETQRTLNTASEAATRLLNHIDATIQTRDRQLEQLLTEATASLEQMRHQTDGLIAQFEATNARVSGLIDANEDNVRLALAHLTQMAERTDALAGRWNQQTLRLEKQLNALLSEAGGWLEETRPQVRELLAAIRETNQQIQPVVSTLQRVVAQLEQGEGTLPRLLNEGRTLDLLEHTLQDAQAALAETRYLTQRVSQATRPPLQSTWDYELRYRHQVGQLDNEANLTLHLDPQWDSQVGVSAREGRWGVNLQLGYHLGPLRLRAGMLRSQSALGLDYALFSRRFRLTLEGVGLTTSQPQLTAEAGIRLHPRLELFVGGEAPLSVLPARDDWEFQWGVRLER